MAKLKTSKSLSKRIRRTKSGKVMRKSAFISHLQVNRSNAQKHRHIGDYTIAKADIKRVKQLVPYQGD
jgi:large subunit ribosomal protein L35